MLAASSADGVTPVTLYADPTSHRLLTSPSLSKTITPAGTNGGQTINTSSGSVNFAPGAASLVVTNSLVTVNSVIVATVAANDATLLSVQVGQGAGSFTLFGNTTATAATRVNFIIFN